jgi:hypothetical protein
MKNNKRLPFGGEEIQIACLYQKNETCVIFPDEFFVSYDGSSFITSNRLREKEKQFLFELKYETPFDNIGKTNFSYSPLICRKSFANNIDPTKFCNLVLLTDSFLTSGCGHVLKIGINYVKNYSDKKIICNNNFEIVNFERSFIKGKPRHTNGGKTTHYDGYHHVSIPDDAIVIMFWDCILTNKFILHEKILYKDMSYEMAKIFVGKYKRAMKYLSKEFQKDPTLCEIACKYAPLSIRYMAQKIRNDCSYIKLAIKSNNNNDSSPYRFISNKQKQNKEIILYALRYNSLVYKWLSPTMQKNKDVIIATIVSNNYYLHKEKIRPIIIRQNVIDLV